MTSAATKEVEVHLPDLHPKQAEILASNAKRISICSGRRSGKTTLAAWVSVHRFLEARRVLLASTTQDQADAFWEKCKDWLRPLIECGLVQKNEQRRMLDAWNGGRIKVKTASDADTLRGDHADFLVLDECALLAPDAWDKVGAPMLLDNDGDAWFISTPRRRNWFFGLYQKAQMDESGRWKAFHFTSFDNPHLSQDALAEITGDLTEEAYRQEIMAEFLEGEGSVFRNITPNLTAPMNAQPQDHLNHKMVMGVDWGQKNDSTALSVVCSDCRCEVALDRFNKIEWAFQRARLDTLAKRWKVQHIEAEENSIGSPNIEALHSEGLPVRAFTTTAASKPPLIQSLALAFERAECRWLDVPVATAELEAYESKVSPTTSRVSYSAPDNFHDDTVIARALAWRAITSTRAWVVSG
jgi:Terminase large subunit, T4likevirus-type, N-terminal